MMFTDEDLKRLKDCLSGNPPHEHPTGGCFSDIGDPNWISPLLARLEAAEKVANYQFCVHREDVICECCKARIQWRKAAGK